MLLDHSSAIAISGILDHPLPLSRVMTAVLRPRVTSRGSPLFRAGIDGLPKVFAVLDLLHLGVQPAIAARPVLYRVGIIGHQVRCPLRAGDLDAEREGLVVIGLVE